MTSLCVLHPVGRQVSCTHVVVLGGLEQDPEEPVGGRAAAERQHRLVQVLLRLQGQQQLKRIRKHTAHDLSFTIVQPDGVQKPRHTQHTHTDVHNLI